MKQPIQVTCFFEDVAQERFLKALIERAGARLGPQLTIRVRNATHGSRVWKELASYFQDLEKGVEAQPDLLVVSLDSDCKNRGEVRKEVQSLADRYGFLKPLVCAIAEPHVERRYLEDQEALAKLFPGIKSQKLKYKCEKDWYKKALVEAIRSAGIEPLLGGAEYGADIAQHMNPQRLDKSFQAFWDELGKVLKANSPKK
jgi:hypothetical protein